MVEINRGLLKAPSLRECAMMSRGGDRVNGPREGSPEGGEVNFCRGKKKGFARALGGGEKQIQGYHNRGMGFHKIQRAAMDQWLNPKQTKVPGTKESVCSLKPAGGKKKNARKR